MSTMIRAALLGGAAALAGIIGAPSASATPPVPTPEPGGVIRMDTAPGEWWNCGGWSLQAPFVGSDPMTGLSTGRPLYLRFAPGADVWVFCTGTSLPFNYWGPIVRAGE